MRKIHGTMSREETPVGPTCGECAYFFGGGGDNYLVYCTMMDSDDVCREDTGACELFEERTDATPEYSLFLEWSEFDEQDEMSGQEAQVEEGGAPP